MKMTGKLICCHGIFGSLLLNAAAGRDQTVSPVTTTTVTPTNNTQTLSCSGTNVTCNYVLNAVGDLKDISVKGTKAAELGAITKPRELVIIQPSIGEKKLFRLQITKAFSSKKRDKALVNKPMEILFVSSEPDAEGIKQKPEATVMTKIYRRMEGEKLWNERATILVIVPIKLFLTIQPNGVVNFILEGEDRAVHLGEA